MTSGKRTSWQPTPQQGEYRVSFIIDGEMYEKTVEVERREDILGRVRDRLR